MNSSADVLNSCPFAADAGMVGTMQESFLRTDSLDDLLPSTTVQDIHRRALELNMGLPSTEWELWEHGNTDGLVDIPLGSTGYDKDFGHEVQQGISQDSSASVPQEDSTSTEQHLDDESEVFPPELVDEDTEDIESLLDFLDLESRDWERIPQEEGSIQAPPLPRGMNLNFFSNNLADAQVSLMNAMAAQKVAPTKNCSASDKIASRKKKLSATAKPLVVTKRRTTVNKKKNKKRHRKRKDNDPEENRVYVSVVNNDIDVLLGRGGVTNRNKGNLLYHDDKLTLQDAYLAATKPGRTLIAQQLVDIVQERGGRFVQQDKVGWFIVSNITARTKCGQALRETKYTAEERAQKRAHYRALKKKASTKNKN